MPLRPTYMNQQVVVGPLRSTTSEAVALLLGVLKRTPQVSYGSSSPTLSDKSVYPSFFRTFPSDASAAITICQLLSSQLNLTEASIFYSVNPSHHCPCASIANT